MTRVPPVPLAWRNLAHDPVRFALFAAGIGFAVVLMGVQLGIMNGMLDGNTLLLRRLDAELVLVNPARPAVVFPEAFVGGYPKGLGFGAHNAQALELGNTCFV